MRLSLLLVVTGLANALPVTPRCAKLEKRDFQLLATLFGQFLPLDATLAGFPPQSAPDISAPSAIGSDPSMSTHCSRIAVAKRSPQGLASWLGGLVFPAAEGESEEAETPANPLAELASFFPQPAATEVSETSANPLAGLAGLASLFPRPAAPASAEALDLTDLFDPEGPLATSVGALFRPQPVIAAPATPVAGGGLAGLASLASSFFGAGVPVTGGAAAVNPLAGLAGVFGARPQLVPETPAEPVEQAESVEENTPEPVVQSVETETEAEAEPVEQAAGGSDSAAPAPAVPTTPGGVLPNLASLASSFLGGGAPGAAGLGNLASITTSFLGNLFRPPSTSSPAAAVPVTPAPAPVYENNGEPPATNAAESWAPPAPPAPAPAPVSEPTSAPSPVPEPPSPPRV